MFVYMIQHKTNPSLIYIGNTDDIDKKICKHRSECYNQNHKPYDYKLNKIIRDNGGWDAFKVQIIDAVITEDRIPLLEFTQYYMDKFQSVKSMNTYNAIISKQNEKEYQKQYHAQYNSQYYKENAEKLKANQVEYRKENAEHIKQVKAEYNRTHKEELAIYQKKRRSYQKAVKELLAIDV